MFFITLLLPPYQVVEGVKDLNLSHNRLHSLDGIHAFVAVETLNLRYNLVASRKDLDRLAQRGGWKTRRVTGEGGREGGRE